MPKKRGPKTDVLEALLKRVDGLEAKLKEKKENGGSSPTTTEDEPPTPIAISAPTTPTIPSKPSVFPVNPAVMPGVGDTIEVKQKSAPPPDVDTTHAVEMTESVVYTPSSSRQVELKERVVIMKCKGGPNMLTRVSSAPSPSGLQTDALVDTFFARFHAKPFFILEESSIRQRLQAAQLPTFLVHAIYAVAAR